MIALAPAALEPAAAPGPAAARGLRLQLESLGRIVTRLTPSQYVAAPSPACGPIGAHVRHCLDHVRALGSWTDGEISYDSRLRGTTVEVDPRAASREIDALLLALEDVAADRLDDEVVLKTMTEPGLSVRVRSTLGRELAYVVQHTTHHAAVLAVLLALLGADVPDGFGYAPSTPRRA